VRFVRNDVTDHVVPHKNATDLRIGDMADTNGGIVRKSAFARFLASFDFRLFQQYLPEPDLGDRNSGDARLSEAHSAGE
jgi:hypothetical protein